MSNYEVEILVRGRPVKTYEHNENYFIEGRKGSNFELRFKNHTWSQVEVVPSVDGLSVMTGEECGIDSIGYLVPARDSIVIPGWRIDNNNIANFVFKGKEKGYSNKTGKGTQNSGVIGFMVFEEKPANNPVHNYGNYEIDDPFHPFSRFSKNIGHINTPFYSRSVPTTGDPMPQDAFTTSSAAIGDDEPIISNSVVDKTNGIKSFASTSSDIEVFDLGVGFGDESNHKVTEVDFIRQNPHTPDEMIIIYYDSQKGLESRGIQVVKTKTARSLDLPNPFPSYTEVGCKPPKGWKGKRKRK